MIGRRRFIPVIAAALIGAAAPPAEYVVTGDGVVPVVVNGVPGRIRIDPAAPSLAMLAPSYGARAQLRPGPFAFVYMVGPERVEGRTAVARIGMDGARPRRRRLGWTQRPYAADTDGAIGPGGLPQRLVRFVLRAPLPGERTVALPLIDEGGLFGGWGASYAVIEVGGAPMRVRFDPHQPRTLATAGAGVRLAAAHDGRIGGDTESVAVAFGIARPVRTLRLGRPLTIGPLTIPALGVRTADFGNASSIREEGGDPDEIVVTAERRRNPARDRIAIGADSLARCSSIVFDKPARRIMLTCA